MSAWTTGQTPYQMMAVLVAAGARQEQAAEKLASLAHKPGDTRILWGVMVQCTTGWNGSNTPVFEYDLAPTFGNTSRTLFQTAAALAAAGATADQASQALHSLAWTPGQSVTLWGVLVTCTSGWNTTQNPQFSYTTNPV